MATMLLPDQTYGDEFRKKRLKNLEHMNNVGSYQNTAANSRRSLKPKDINKNKSKIRNSDKMKRCNNRERQLRYRLNDQADSESEDSLEINGVECEVINDEMSLHSFTSESGDDEIIDSLLYFQTDPQLVSDGYNQEMARILKGIKVWETTSGGDNNTISRKQTSHHQNRFGLGSESSTNKKSFNEHKRTTSWDAYRARQKSKHFLSRNNIRPEFFCQYKHLTG